MTGEQQASAQDDITRTLRDLVALRSDYPPGDTHGICDYIGVRLARAGYTVSKHVQEEPFANLIARAGSGTPRIVLNAHVDTVAVDDPDAWTMPPLSAQLRDGHLFGLGAANCKGSTAAQIHAAEALARSGALEAPGEITFTFVADEEAMGPSGMAYLHAHGLVRPEVLIVGAPTDNELIVAERGAMWVEITTLGRTAHAGDPTAGDNAIERMARLLGRLRGELFDRLDERRDGDMVSTANVGVIEGGHNTNAVPSRCAVQIDRRLLPEETVEGAFGEIEQVLDASGEPDGSWRTSLLLGSEGFRAAPDSRLVAAFDEAIAARTGSPARLCNAMGVSDARHFAREEVELVGFGPGAGSAGHAADESVPVSQLVDAALIYESVIRRLRAR